ncbi:MAG: 2-C-methyl-D-erythritol 4-phosphate cytidylyltransferase [Candidatus Thioglobus sp.]|nr:2-C-methyl-D-erythritol 4-phosphate cytidylyltransferase [Candidatus Thioglobus sp.]
MAKNQHFLIVPASGIGARMKGKIPKQYLKLNNGLSVLEQTLETLMKIEKISGFVIVLAEQDKYFSHSKFAQNSKLLSIAIGGKRRFDSVLAGLNSLKSVAKNDDWVLVHDAVRPCVAAADVENLITQLEQNPTGGLLATKVTDTIKQADNSGQITLDRSKLWQAQTPQMYRFGVLFEALENVAKNDFSVTDEAGAIEYLGLKSLLVEGCKSNLKITTAADLALANFYLSANYYEN